MQSREIRKQFLDFFKKQAHVIIPSASLVPKNDPSVLFTTAGMQQFKSYYISKADAQKDLNSLNVASSQKCVRTSDIEEVGDKSHLTFFEMLGNFSFGGYWKKEAIEYAHELITKDFGLKIDFISVFGGADNIPEDKESADIWKSIDSSIIIKKFGREDNFWGPTGEEGPCGPTTEIYVGGIEIWNIVFNEYYQSRDKELTPLKIRGVDTGMGLERLTFVTQGVSSAFETDLFESIIKRIKDISSVSEEKAERIVSDHIRTSVFMIADGVIASNTDRGYILRRLIRRAVRYADILGIAPGELFHVARSVILKYRDIYPELAKSSERIEKEILAEENKFRKTLREGLKQFEKGVDSFILFTTYGFPIELTEEIAREKGEIVDKDKFYKQLKEHQELSRKSSGQKFKK